MRRLLLFAVAVLMAVSTQAQKLQIVDSEGYAIPLASVLTEDGVLIGTTDLNGRLADAKGAKNVVVTHVAYQPQKVSVSSLTNGRIVMESVDYGLEDIVVKPKPYLFMEYYFRGFSYIGDSLRTYAAGIIPVAHEIAEHYKGETRNLWAYGGAANKALSWNTTDLMLMAEKGVKTAVIPMEDVFIKSEKAKNYYQVSIEQDGENRWKVSNPEGPVGQFVHGDGIYRATLDAGRIQMYANKVNGEERQLKAREKRNYDYQYTEVFELDDEGKIQPYNFVMEMSHWEHDSSKGRRITIIYLYATDHGYMDKAEFKAHNKALNKGRSGDMTLAELEEYERSHNIPPLDATMLNAIQQLKKKTGE